MKSKRGILVAVLILSLFIIPFICAQNETGIDKAYSCLKTQLGTDCEKAETTEQNAFSLLAMAYDSGVQSDCKSKLNAKKKTNNCWGETSSASCDIKYTALSVIALKNLGVNVDSSVDWLLTKKILSKELDWFLEIDSSNATKCKIKVNGGSESTFNMAENKKMSGSSNCLAPAEQDYFLKIANSCLDKNFTISCEDDFKTTLIYKKPNSNVLYISSETHSAVADSSTEERIESYCFAESNTCNFEASLWAALALGKAGEDVTSYIPYITAMAENTENKKYLPFAFLYILTSGDDYFSEIVNNQKPGKFWDESGKKFYDTALALLALDPGAESALSSKEYLLNNQDSSGCWNSNNIRDTSFLLYAGWPKQPASTDDSPSAANCLEFNKFCVASGECSSEEVLPNFYCSGAEVCCETNAPEETCSEKGGKECLADEECDGSTYTSSDTLSCCVGKCSAITTTNDCIDAGNVCRVNECGTGQKEVTGYFDCEFDEVCCKEEGGSSKLWLIILLIILIILVVLAILFREQLKVWLFRIKSNLKFGKGPASSSRPSSPPPGFGQMIFPQRQIIPRQAMPPRTMPRPPARSPARKSEKEGAFEETMKKLREMSK